MGRGDRGTHEGSRIDLYDPYSARWRSVDTGITRLRAASTLLPDGTVLLLSGEAMWRDNDSIGDRRRPTLFDPQSGQVIHLAPWSEDSEDRGYHNFSLLLKDGRVLVGGGRTLKRNSAGVEQFRIGCERTDVRIFSPPYLFRGPRPSVQGAAEPMAMRAGSPPFELHFVGPAPRAAGSVVLMAMGSETHHFDQNQRIVKLSFRVSGPGILQITPPPNTLAAPEGEYDLFLVSDAGVPSLGVLVRVGPASRLARVSSRR